MLPGCFQHDIAGDGGAEVEGGLGQAAIDKLDHIIVNVAYPDKWQDYTSLSLDGLNYRECWQKNIRF